MNTSLELLASGYRLVDGPRTEERPDIDSFGRTHSG